VCRFASSASGNSLVAVPLATESAPLTPSRLYGATAILYTTYELDLLSDGKTATQRGAATEVFVQRDGKWLNTGWQLAPVTPASGGR